MGFLENFIKEIRKFGLTKAAKLSNISFRTIRGWCSGKRIPTLDRVIQVADAMGLELLLFEKEDNDDQPR